MIYIFLILYFINLYFLLALRIILDNYNSKSLRDLFHYNSLQQ